MTYLEGAYSVWPYVPEPGEVVRVMPQLPRGAGQAPLRSYLAGRVFCVAQTNDYQRSDSESMWWVARGIPAVTSTCQRLHHFCIVQPLPPDEAAAWRLSNG